MVILYWIGSFWKGKPSPWNLCPCLAEFLLCRQRNHPAISGASVLSIVISAWGKMRQAKKSVGTVSGKWGNRMKKGKPPPAGRKEQNVSIFSIIDSCPGIFDWFSTLTAGKNLFKEVGNTKEKGGSLMGSL